MGAAFTFCFLSVNALNITLYKILYNLSAY